MAPQAVPPCSIGLPPAKCSLRSAGASGGESGDSHARACLCSTSTQFVQAQQSQIIRNEWKDRNKTGKIHEKEGNMSKYKKYETQNVYFNENIAIGIAYQYTQSHGTGLFFRVP